jgi:hypothetical protein
MNLGPRQACSSAYTEWHEVKPADFLGRYGGPSKGVEIKSVCLEAPCFDAVCRQSRWSKCDNPQNVWCISDTPLRRTKTSRTYVPDLKILIFVPSTIPKSLSTLFLSSLCVHNRHLNAWADIFNIYFGNIVRIVSSSCVKFTWLSSSSAEWILASEEGPSH